MSKNLDSKNQKNSLVFETLNDVSTMQVTESKDAKGNTLMSLTGTFGVCGVLNNNNRIYETSNYKAMVDILKKEIAEKGGIPGELEHPNTMNITLDNVSHKITDINIDESGLVTGTIVLLDTPKGQLAQSIVRGGLPLYVSSRATGEIKESKVCLSKIYTYDLVGTPGFSQARVHLNENQSVTQLNESVYVISENNNDTNTKKPQKPVNEGDYEKFVEKFRHPDLRNVRYEALFGDDSEVAYKGLMAAVEDNDIEFPFADFGIGRHKKPEDCLLIVVDGHLVKGKSVDFDFDYSQWLTTAGFFVQNVTNICFANLDKNPVNINLVGWSAAHIEAECGTTFSYGDNINFYDYAGEEGTDEWEMNESTKKSNNNDMTEQINEAVLASENRTQDYIINTVMPTIEDWMVESFAPEIQKWLESHYKQSIQEATEDYISKSVAPVIEDWICNEYSKTMENWLNTEYASKLESWITEQFAGILDGYIGEQLTPEILNQTKIQLNETIKENKKNTLVDIKDTLTMLEGLTKTNVNGIVGNFKPAGTINESLNKFNDQPVYIKNMPDHIRPKYLSLNQNIKESIDTRAKLFNFNVPGAIERFWADFDERYGKNNFTNVNEAGTNGTGQVSSGLILDNRERAIREALRARMVARQNRF